MTTGTDHACPGGCGASVPRHRFACPSGWYRLPIGLRKSITSNYKVNPLAHMEAMTDAIDWYRNQA